MKPPDDYKNCARSFSVECALVQEKISLLSFSFVERTLELRNG